MVEEFKEVDEIAKIKEVSETIASNEEIIRRLNKSAEDKQLLELMIRRLDMKEDAEHYDYEEMVELLNKFVIGIKSPLELINEEEIFDLFLIKFKTNILGDKIEFSHSNLSNQNDE
jgi:hypothetical protein